jgi:hypothetical protein
MRKYQEMCGLDWIVRFIGHLFSFILLSIALLGQHIKNGEEVSVATHVRVYFGFVALFIHLYLCLSYTNNVQFQEKLSDIEAIVKSQEGFAESQEGEFKLREQRKALQDLTRFHWQVGYIYIALPLCSETTQKEALLCRLENKLRELSAENARQASLKKVSGFKFYFIQREREKQRWNSSKKGRDKKSENMPFASTKY